MVTIEDFNLCIRRLGAQAFEDIEWSERIAEPVSARDFALECIFVICNSGMKNTVAQGIYAKVVNALEAGDPVSAVFGHKGKVGAINKIWTQQQAYFDAFKLAQDKLAFCASLPWIGEVTKYHLAKNCGADVAKPDVHLVRLAGVHQTTPAELCAYLANLSGYRVATVDTVLWRACANGILDSRTGKMTDTKGGTP